VDFTSDSSGLEHFIVQKSVEIIARRNEPTPYNFIFDGLVPELLQAGLSQLSKSKDSAADVLKSNSGNGKIFTRKENTESKAGDLWWFNEPERYISHPDRPLKDRVEETIIALLRRRVSVRFDDVLAELFREYPNGLTPDIRAVRAILDKYAFKSAGQWKIKSTTNSLVTKHTSVLEQLVFVGKRAQFMTFVGRREQPETCSTGTVLRDVADFASLSYLKFDKQQLERVEMIDALWLDARGNEIVAVFEVENSTNFTSALQRASNLDPAIPKFMVIPDNRKNELVRTRDPLFVATFRSHNWRFVLYTDIEKLSGYSKPSLAELTRISEEL
jgi:hypothetical protein